MKIIVGQGSCGLAAGAGKVYDAIAALNPKAALGITGCIGMCYLEPIVDLYDGDKLVKRLVQVSETDAEAIVKAADNGDLDAVAHIAISSDDESFLSQQTRIALRNCGVIDPTSIDAYIQSGGYEALKKEIGRAHV